MKQLSADVGIPANSEGGHVSSILWWDHCKKKAQHMSVGSGGYSDPDDTAYMYAETQFYEDGLETRSLQEIKSHISERRTAGLILGDKYFAFDLVPSFYLSCDESGFTGESNA